MNIYINSYNIRKFKDLGYRFTKKFITEIDRFNEEEKIFIIISRL